ncbi:MAG: flippase [Atopobiaceae bacterium]|nr:flippase [Atopobiaceae bacterium]
MDRKTIKNYAYNMAYQVLVLLAPLVTTPYVSRVLHSDGIGIYSYTFTIATAFSLLAALGVNSYGQREVAYRQDDEVERSKVFWELLILRAVVSGAVVVAYLVFCAVYGKYEPYLLAQTFVILSVLLDISWFFQGMEDFRPIALRNAAVRIATIALIFLLVRSEADLLMYCLINSASLFVGNMLFFVGLGKRVRRVPLAELNVSRHIVGTLQFFVPIIAVQIYSQLDKIMLGALLDDVVQNGYYEQTRKVANLVVTLVVSLNTVLYSRNAHLFSEGDHAGVRQSMRESFEVLCMIMLPLVVGLFMVTNNLVGWFMGPDFGPVVPLLRLCCVLIVFMCVGNFVGMQYLSPTGLQNKMTAAYIAAAVVDVVVNFVLVRQLGALGALCASLAAEFCSCGLQVWMLARSEYRFSPWKDLLPYMLAVGAMAAALWGWQQITPFGGIVQTVTEMCIGAAVYGLLLVVLPGTALNKLTAKWRKA